MIQIVGFELCIFLLFHPLMRFLKVNCLTNPRKVRILEQMPERKSLMPVKTFKVRLSDNACPLLFLCIELKLNAQDERLALSP